MTVSITPSAFTLSGPLVAGERVGVSVSGFAFAAEDKPTLALLARFPDALLASVELAESEDAPGTWTGELDTATKQAGAFMLTARADERRDAVLELVAGRESLARVSAPMLNSALCPKPKAAPDSSPVYIPVPGPQGPQGDPGALRGRQYSYTVEEGDEIAVPADATSIVLSAEGAVEITITPPAIADGADWSVWILGADGQYNGILVDISGYAGNALQVNQAAPAIAMKRGSGFFAFQLTP